MAVGAGSRQTQETSIEAAPPAELPWLAGQVAHDPERPGLPTRPEYLSNAGPARTFRPGPEIYQDRDFKSYSIAT